MIARHPYEIALIEAIKQGRVPHVETFIAFIQETATASMESTDEQKRHFIHIAYEESSSAVLDVLKRHTPQWPLVKDGNGNTLFHLASLRGDIATMQACLDMLSFQEGTGLIDQVNREGNTPLYLACKKQSVRAVEFLLGHGAQLNFENNQGERVNENDFTPEGILNLARQGYFIAKHFPNAFLSSMQLLSLKNIAESENPLMPIAFFMETIASDLPWEADFPVQFVDYQVATSQLALLDQEPRKRKTQLLEERGQSDRTRWMEIDKELDEIKFIETETLLRNLEHTATRQSPYERNLALLSFSFTVSAQLSLVELCLAHFKLNPLVSPAEEYAQKEGGTNFMPIELQKRLPTYFAKKIGNSQEKEKEKENEEEKEKEKGKEDSLDEVANQALEIEETPVDNNASLNAERNTLNQLIQHLQTLRSSRKLQRKKDVCRSDIAQFVGIGGSSVISLTILFVLLLLSQVLPQDNENSSFYGIDRTSLLIIAAVIGSAGSALTLIPFFLFCLHPKAVLPLVEKFSRIDDETLRQVIAELEIVYGVVSAREDINTTPEFNAFKTKIDDLTTIQSAQHMLITLDLLIKDIQRLQAHLNDTKKPLGLGPYSLFSLSVADKMRGPDSIVIDVRDPADAVEMPLLGS